MHEASAGRAIKSFLVLRTLSQLGDAHMGESTHAHKFPGSISQGSPDTQTESIPNKPLCFLSSRGHSLHGDPGKDLCGTGLQPGRREGLLTWDKPLTVNRIFKGVMWVPFRLQL